MKNRKIEFMKIENEIRDVIVEICHCRPSKIRLSTNILDDLGIDSFTALEILVLIEKKFEVIIPEAEIRQLRTFNDLVKFMHNKLK
jgi:acyl carrier protein